MAFKKVYIIKRVPVGREEKRASQRELEEINKRLLPFLAAYEKTTEEELNSYNQYFIKECSHINRNKVFVEANPNAMLINCPTIDDDNFQKNRLKKIRTMSISIIAFILFLFICSLLF